MEFWYSNLTWHTSPDNLCANKRQLPQRKKAKAISDDFVDSDSLIHAKEEKVSYSPYSSHSVSSLFFISNTIPSVCYLELFVIYIVKVTTKLTLIRSQLPARLFYPLIAGILTHFFPFVQKNSGVRMQYCYLFCDDYDSGVTRISFHWG